MGASVLRPEEALGAQPRPKAIMQGGTTGWGEIPDLGTSLGEAPVMKTEGPTYPTESD